MRYSALAVAGLVFSMTLVPDAHAQRRGGGGGGSSRGRSGSTITVPANLIADASRALRRDIRLAREQRDSLTKLDTTYVRREREYRFEATTIANAIPTRVASANEELLTRMRALHAEFVLAFKALVPADQITVFDRNLEELTKRLEAQAGQRSLGRRRERERERERGGNGSLGNGSNAGNGREVSSAVNGGGPSDSGSGSDRAHARAPSSSFTDLRPQTA